MQKIQVSSNYKKDPQGLTEKTLQSNLNQLTKVNKILKSKLFDFYTIFEISKELNSNLKLNDFLDRFLRFCTAQLEAEWAVILTQEKFHQKRFVYFKSWGKKLKDKVELGPKSTLLKILRSQPKPQFWEEVLRELKSFNLAKRSLREKRFLEKLKPELVVPLLTKEKIRAILFLSRKCSGLPFFESDLEFLELLSEKAAVTLENTLLYQSERIANQKLKRTQKQLIQAEKLAALSKLSASIAHEVNNPLGIIKNYISILLTKKQDSESKKNLKIIKEEVDRIANILRELIEFHRPTGKKQKLCDLISLVNETCDLVERQFQDKNILMVKKFYADQAQIFGQPDELKQVFLNLLLNSKDSMPRGGKIQIRLSEKNGGFRLEFSDTGMGIPQKNINRIFEPFFTTKSEVKSSGLGLWISYGIIEKHKGTIKVLSNGKDGAVFTIEFPAKKI